MLIRYSEEQNVGYDLGIVKSDDLSIELKQQMTGMNVSQQIRYLDSIGYKRTEISKMLGKRYQHVRNVLTQPLKK